VRIDLHCHSDCSDGRHPPERIGQLAAERQVQLFCLTDHDSLAGSGRAEAAFLAHGPADRPGRVVRGVELSCSDGGRAVHLLLYGAPAAPGWDAVALQLQAQLRARRHRLRNIVERLRQVGVTLDAEAILAAAAGRPVGRPDVAAALLQSGAVRSLQEAYQRYLRDGGPADVPLTLLPVEAALALGRDAGLRTSLAHPHALGSAADERVGRWASAGLGALEAFYGPYTARQRKRWLALAARHRLLVTGGSDFHGLAGSGNERPGIDLPEPHAARLRDWLAAA
jgi:hypothetical protein